MKTIVYLAFVTDLVSAATPEISGERKQWHEVVLTFVGPETSESAEPNPFLAFRLNVNGKTKYVVPGYFAADGSAAETSAKAGNKWRVHFVPDETGTWTDAVSFRTGPEIAASLDPRAGKPVPPDGTKGTFEVAATDKTDRDHRAHGMLAYVGEHYARYRGSGRYFVQTGTQSLRTFSPTLTSTTPSTMAAPRTASSTGSTATSHTSATGNPATPPGRVAEAKRSSALSTISPAKG